MASANPAISPASSDDDLTPPAPQAGEDQLRLKRLIVAGALLVSLAIVGAIVGILWRLSQEQLDGGLARLSTLDLLVAANTEKTFENASLVLDGIAEDFQAAGIASSAALRQAAGDEATYRLLRAKLADVGALDSLSILDADGNVINRTRSYPVVPPVNLATSDFFLRLRDHPEINVYISSPVKGGSDAVGGQTIYVAKRLSAPNGSFVGVLLGAIRSGYLEGVYGGYLDQIGGPATSIALRTDDGTLIAHSPHDPEAATPTSDSAPDRPLPAKGFAAFWEKHGDGSIAVVRLPLGDLPLTLELRQPAGAILRQWTGEALATLCGGGVSLVLVGLVAWLLLRQLNAASLARKERMRADREARARADIFEAMTQAETAMRDAQRSEARFRDILEVGSDWIWETDAQHRFTVVAGARRPKVNLIGMTRWEQVGADPETDPIWREHKALLDAHLPFRQFRFRIEQPDGHFDVCVDGKPVFDDDGSFAGYRGTVTDETELVAAREQAARADALLRNAIDSIAEGFVIYDADDRFVMCNEAYRKMYPENAEGFVPGARYEDIMRQAVATGRYADASGREEEWLAERIRKHRAGGEDEARLANGRWVMSSERRMADGGIAGLRIDITALKTVQNSLRESQAMLNRAQKLSGTGSVVRNLRTKETDWSDEMYRICGVPRNSFTPNTEAFLALVHPDDRPRVAETIARGVNNVTEPPIEFRIVRPDGTQRWVHREADFWHDAHGTPVRLATYKDITDQRAAADRQRKKETMLNRAQRVGRMGSIFRDFAGDTSDWSDEMFRLLGVSRESFKPNIAAFLSMVHPEDRAAVDKSLQAAPQSGDRDTVLFRIIRPDGSLRWLHREAEWLYDDAGRATGAIATFQDVTDLQLAQEALRENQAMLNRAQRVAGVGSALHDFRTRTSQWSEQLYRITGLDPHLAPSSERFLAMVHPEDRAKVEASLDEALAGQEPLALDYRIIRADGTVRLLHREAEVWRDAEGRPIGRLSTFQDVTEIHEAQEALRENQAMLNRAQRVAGVGSVLRKLKTANVQWSDEMYRLIGLTRDSFDPNDTDSFLARVHAEDRARVEQAIHANRRGDAAEPLQFRIVRPDGEVRWLCREVEVFHDTDGKPSEFLTTYKDVTEHVTNETRLRELEAMLRDAIESIQAGFVIYDSDDRLVICNEAYRHTYADVADLLVPGVRFTDILRAQFARHDWPEWKGREEEWIADWQEKRRSITTPVETQMPDGRWILVSERRMSNGWLAGLRVDITELKTIQQSLRESQAMLNLAQRLSATGSAVRNLKTDAVVWSDEMYHLVGLDRSAKLPAHAKFRNFIHPEDRDRVPRVREIALAARSVPPMQFRIVRADGTVRWVHREAELVRDAAGNVTSILTTCKDITERHDLEALLRDAIESVQAGFVIYDANDRLVICNEAYREIYPEIADLAVPGVHFADILRAQGHSEESIADLLKRRRSMTTPIERLMRNGRWVLVSERPMSNGYLAGLRVDITELKHIQQSLRESQQRLDRTQQIAHLGTVERNLRTDEVVWSDETYRIFGLNPAEHAPHVQKLLKFVHPDDREVVGRALQRADREHANSSLKFRIIRPSGEIRTVSSQADLIKDERGEPLAISVAMMDITDKEAASHRQMELETQLRHSEKLTALGTLAGGIAHDLNNTLVPIQALSKLAMKQLPPDTPARGDLETIYQASLQAGDLVRQILAFSRKQEIVHAPTDVGAKLREALQMLRASVPSTIEIVEQIEPVPTILADAGQLQQVVVNLVTNGAHAIGNAFGRVTVSLDEIADPASETGRMIRIRVADTGCGMSREVMHRIFEPFFTTKGVGEGTGLGLSVVHGIVTGQGGSIDVKSTPGKGSEFIILLPAHIVPAEDIAAVA